MKYKGSFLKYFCVFATAFLLLSISGCGDGHVVYDIQTDDSSKAAQTVSGSAASEEISSETGDSSRETEDLLNQNADDSSGKQSEHAQNLLKAYICGAVNIPGVYELLEGARICDLIAAAGGLRADAEERLVNQAAVLEDGMQITIYTKEECATTGIDVTAGSTAAEAMARMLNPQVGSGTDSEMNAGNSTKVNLNTASKEELMTLSGIGESKADSILTYRSDNGGFDSIEAIMNVEGIKDKLFEKIKDQIEV